MLSPANSKQRTKGVPVTAIVYPYMQRSITQIYHSMGKCSEKRINLWHINCLYMRFHIATNHTDFSSHGKISLTYKLKCYLTEKNIFFGNLLVNTLMRYYLV